MIKNKLKALFIFLLIFLLIFSNYVFAVEEVESIEENVSEDTTEEIIVEDDLSSENNAEILSESEENDVVSISDFEENNEDTYLNASIQSEDTVENDVYLVGDNITIDYFIDGNVFIFASTVNINSQIAGNAFICANTINISEQGHILNNLYAISSNINIEGVIYDLYTSSENITIKGYIYRDIHTISKNINIFGVVGRNAFVNSNAINFPQKNDQETEEAYNQSGILGNLTYESSNQINIPDGFVEGETIAQSGNNSIVNYIVSLISFLILIVIIWLILKWTLPKFIEKTDIISKKKLLPILGFGLLGFICVPIISALLLLTKFTVSVGLLVLATYFILICISSAIFIISLNNLICKKLKFNKSISIFGMLIATTVVAYLLNIIPYVGFIFTLIYIVLGLGIIFTNLINTTKSESRKL